MTNRGDVLSGGSIRKLSKVPTCFISGYNTFMKILPRRAAFCGILFLGCLLSTAAPMAAQADTDAPTAQKEKKKRKKKATGYDASIPAPTLTNVKYGDQKRNVLDFWRAPSDTPTPVVVSIHGGGWNGGSKEDLAKYVDCAKLLKAGISVVSINYRLIKMSHDQDPYVKGPMTDGARAIQFVRSMADEWNIDPDRVGVVGGSAGACTSLWLAYHDDLAEPDSQDPVARESTRPNQVAAIRAQTTLDPKQMKKWMPKSKYGAHAFGLDSFEDFLAQRDRILAGDQRVLALRATDLRRPGHLHVLPNRPHQEGREKSNPLGKLRLTARRTPQIVGRALRAGVSRGERREARRCDRVPDRHAANGPGLKS